nr:hypothetical protein [Tanacetum cinerariifolium]
MAPLTFTDTHNMITFLTKSDESEGFDQIVNFLNAHMIRYALMVNLTIYVLCIKQFWTSVSIKKTNDVVRLQALIDRKKVIITEDIIRQALRLDYTASVDCLPNEEIFAKLARMGYEKPTGKGFSGVDTLLFDGGKIAELDANEDVTLVDVEEDVNADVQERLTESQAKVYHMDLEHAKKVLSMQDTDEAETAEVEEVIEVVIAAKLMTEVVTTAATTITAAQVPKASAIRRMRGVVIQDPKKTVTASVIVHSEVNSGNLKNMAGFKMDFFKGMTYNDIRPIFEKHYNLNQAFLEKVEEKVIGQKEEGNKRKCDSLNQDAAKKQRIDEETKELKTHIQIIANDDDDVYTEATPLALMVHVVDYQIHHEHNKPYYKIIRADETHQLFLSFITLLKNFDREDLELLWKLVQEKFQSSEPKNFSDEFLLNTLKIMFEKPNVKANIWRDQKGRYGLEKVKSWKYSNPVEFTS